MSKRNFPSFIEAFLEYTKNLGAPDKFVLWSAFSGIAACLERKTWIVYRGITPVYPNIFVMIVAESGIANKSTATKPIVELLYGVDGVKQLATQMTGASLVKQMFETGESKKVTFGSDSYRHSAMFSYSSEAKVTLGDAKSTNGIQELITDFYDCGPIAGWSDRQGWNKTLVGSGSTTVFNPCLNILHCSTPTWLLEALGKTGIEGGLASRCFIVFQKEPHEANRDWLEEDEIIEKPDMTAFKKKLIEDLTQIHKMQGEFKPLRGFGEVYNRINKANDVMKKDTIGKQTNSYYTRKMWHLLKLTQILAADRGNEMIIRPEYLEYAEDLLKSIEQNMFEAFGVRGANPLASPLSKVWEVLRKKPAFTKQELIRVAWTHANMKNIDEMIQVLTSFGKVMPVFGVGITTYKVIDDTPLSLQ